MKSQNTKEAKEGFKKNFVVEKALLPPHLLFYFFVILGLHLWHMEVPWLGVKSEL